MKDVGKIIDHILDMPLDEKKMENYKPFDMEIFLLDKKNPVAAETLLDKRHGHELTIAGTLRRLISHINTSLKQLLEKNYVKKYTELQYWLFDEAVRQYAEKHTDFYQTYIPDANEFFEIHPWEDYGDSPDSKDYIHDRVSHYLTIQACLRGILDE